MSRSTVLAVSCVLVAACASGADPGTTVDPGGGGDPDAGGGPPGNLSVPLMSDLFRFGIVGDTRPAGIDGTSHYPTTIITKIWSDIEAESPHPDFAVTTGDYMFARTTGSQALPQMDLYLTARKQFSSAVYYALGNHECTGATTSNCGPGTSDANPKNFTVFMSKMIQPMGFNAPCYSVNFMNTAKTWTAKLVVIAGNSWTPTQATWLETTLANPTTYTFVVRHESTAATTAPGVTPSTTIIKKHPLTLLIVGHEHTYKHNATEKEVICGNGGAPLVSATSYGYGMVERRADGAIKFAEYDYMSHAVIDSFVVNPDGTPTS